MTEKAAKKFSAEKPNGKPIEGLKSLGQIVGMDPETGDPIFDNGKTRMERIQSRVKVLRGQGQDQADMYSNRKNRP